MRAIVLEFGNRKGIWSKPPMQSLTSSKSSSTEANKEFEYKNYFIVFNPLKASLAIHLESLHRRDSDSEYAHTVVKRHLPKNRFQRRTAPRL